MIQEDLKGATKGESRRNFDHEWAFDFRGDHEWKVIFSLFGFDVFSKKIVLITAVLAHMYTESCMS